MGDRIVAEVFEPDDMGYWYHSSIKEYHYQRKDDWESDQAFDCWLRRHGIKHREYMAMYDDDQAPESVVDDYATGMSGGGCVGWTPTQPLASHEGILLSVYDSQDGPLACFGYHDDEKTLKGDV